MKPLKFVRQEEYQSAIRFYKKNKEKVKEEFDIPKEEEIETLEELWEYTGEITDADIIQQVVENQYPEEHNKRFYLRYDPHSDFIILRIYKTS